MLATFLIIAFWCVVGVIFALSRMVTTAVHAERERCARICEVAAYEQTAMCSEDHAPELRAVAKRIRSVDQQ